MKEGIPPFELLDSKTEKNTTQVSVANPRLPKMLYDAIPESDMK